MHNLNLIQKREYLLNLASTMRATSAGFGDKNSYKSIKKEIDKSNQEEKFESYLKNKDVKQNAPITPEEFEKLEKEMKTKNGR